jgi:tripartite-type tricarboxylate transporter receptor subunit TctC
MLRLFALGLIAALSSQGGATAQNFPEKPVQMVVPFDAGGNTDLIARALQEEMGRRLGQPVVVVNKGGASGVLGMGELARARPDGHTIGLAPIGPLTFQPNIRKLPYSYNSFEYICQVYSVPVMMMVLKTSPFKTVEEVIEFARSKPNAFVYGMTVGAIQHISMEAFLKKIGAKGTAVPFRGGGEIAQAILGGTVMAVNDAPSMATTHDLRPLATFTEARVPEFPTVPTMREKGIDFVAPVWGGLVAPQNVPAAILGKLESACEAAVTSPAYAQAAARLNAPPQWRRGSEFRQFVEAQFKDNGAVIRDAGLQARD